jgi:hypothetical protein
VCEISLNPGINFVDEKEADSLIFQGVERKRPSLDFFAEISIELSLNTMSLHQAISKKYQGNQLTVLRSPLKKMHVPGCSGYGLDQGGARTHERARHVCGIPRNRASSGFDRYG